ncbi:hypothetical protein TWF225_007593 [Orbilia oligospora]|uniref:Uncharacterized protein n=1 Tax=Orbilia oligospora TaxID=2813651 RepID=A0A7C8KA28_ORBOL|nr:hypothetical protein TWF751_003644 [Orbilia oligospora]KAF3179392.1 hypothetical protein TWF225_007593 [Orbilia oligospora]KAF3253140.1 hypothetical protein TWF128_006573 [Orbilia oligospora]KAF3266994.1 hypothetical protein TWF217_001067 [Orbilia oligospora]KAF3280997.1 hypothetical protein TWF132_011409 [Orbilia oligospora]
MVRVAAFHCFTAAGLSGPSQKLVGCRWRFRPDIDNQTAGESDPSVACFDTKYHKIWTCLSEILYTTQPCVGECVAARSERVHHAAATVHCPQGCLSSNSRSTPTPQMRARSLRSPHLRRCKQPSRNNA